ncbi:putative GPI anchored protein [Aspergillus mulundensis]|uniref:GPI anchored protein n=1 Tax=Aspergillus mulundensis TaxID=1810919 RepID=A0A3D8SBC8_9EURO|nr:Uncharacterized protein DSM5745_03995 [Aspergillus mulundensis]RDW83669.1 Uncharacterized protein DSM5745_03995 [Aspergillus mulundensis]
MLVKSLLIPTLASLAYAESTVTSMFIYGADPQPLAASIVGNDASATTYSINCPPGSDCGMGPGLTLIADASKTTYIMNDGDSFQFTVKCAVTESSATCVESAGGPDANFPGVETSTTDVSLMPVTVTAGTITSADGSTTSTSTSTATTATATATGSPTSSSTGTTSTAAQGSGSGNATQTAQETGADPTETGAAVKLNGVFGVVVGGAAVALMGAVL